MDAKELQKLKKILLNEKQRLLNNSATSRKRDFSIPTEDLADDSDHTSTELSQGIVFTLREKEQKTLSEIDNALHRMDEGDYGCCEDCGDPIGFKRLELYPTARYCVTHQEEVEKRKKFYVA